MLVDKSTDNVKSVYNIDLRTKIAMESFTLTKGTGTVFIFFEEVPICLSVLAPMCFKYLHFSLFKSFNDLERFNVKTKMFIRSFLKDWPRDRIKFRSDPAETPTVVLVSGSKNFLKSFDMGKHEVLLVFTIEYCRKQVWDKVLKFKWYHNFRNEGCLGIKLLIGFVNIAPPKILTSIKRSLGDFIDYGNQPVY